MTDANRALSLSMEAFTAGTRAYAVEVGADPDEVVNAPLLLSRALCEAMRYAIDHDAAGDHDEVRAAIAWARVHVAHLDGAVAPEAEELTRYIVAAANALIDDGE